MLRDRIHDGHAGRLEGRRSAMPSRRWTWRVEPVTFSPRKEKSFGEEESKQGAGGREGDQGAAQQRRLPARLAEARSAGRST